MTSQNALMVEPAVREEILRQLQTLEQAHSMRVLYAVESGSRAWGFASPDSDYDVRFIYIRPLDWYLSVQNRRDVIEQMGPADLDFAGWDLQKTLPLLAKSNPSLLEWLGSPIVYSQDEGFMSQLREVAAQCLSLDACTKHYTNMANNNWLSYFAEGEVRLKKYLYVLRPIFACRWIERYASLPPVLFNELLAGANESGAVQEALDALLEEKSRTSELGSGRRIPTLDAFIEGELARFRAFKAGTPKRIDYEELDRFFRSSVYQMQLV